MRDHAHAGDWRGWRGWKGWKGWVLLLAVLTAGLPGPVAPQTDVRAVTNRAATADTVVAVGFTVADMERSVEFFTNVLDFEKVYDREVTGSEYDRLQGVFGVRMRVVGLGLGDERIELTEYLTPRGRPIPVDALSNDRSFQHIAIVVSDMDRAYEILRRHRVTHISPGPQRLPDWNPNAGGIEAFYFRDPDGHPLELIHYPPDKGDPRWQRPTSRLFLGIDHTAIVVGDTRGSLAFYRDLLGLRVVGGSENYGPEQERLNGVFGARLRITALRAAGGPGIEFLEYVTPRNGRPIPPDQRASDLQHWQTTLVSSDAAAVAARLQEAGYTFVSPDVVELPGAALGFRKAFLVRDPDGHVMQLIQR